MNKIILATILGLATMTTTASAYDSQREIDHRQAVQEQRIQNARRSGELTRGEYVRLEAEQARIREMERRAQRDGHVDRREASEIRRAQNEASKHISQESHDSDRARRYRWW